MVRSLGAPVKSSDKREPTEAEACIPKIMSTSPTTSKAIPTTLCLPLLLLWWCWRPLRPCRTKHTRLHRQRQSAPGGARAHPLGFFQCALKGASDYGLQMGGNGTPQQSAEHGDVRGHVYNPRVDLHRA